MASYDQQRGVENGGVVGGDNADEIGGAASGGDAKTRQKDPVAVDRMLNA